MPSTKLCTTPGLSPELIFQTTPPDALRVLSLDIRPSIILHSAESLRPFPLHATGQPPDDQLGKITSASSSDLAHVLLPGRLIFKKLPPPALAQPRETNWKVADATHPQTTPHKGGILIRLEIETDNDAFQPSKPEGWRKETAAILTDLTDRIITGQALPIILRDSNGNTVGRADNDPS